MQFTSKTVPQEVVNVINLNFAALSLYVQQRMAEKPVVEKQKTAPVETRTKKRKQQKTSPANSVTTSRRRRINSEGSSNAGKPSGFFPFPPFPY